MKRYLAGLVLLMLACSQPASKPSSQPLPPLTPSASPPSTAQVAWPASLATTQVEFNCRLPVLDVSSAGAGINDAFIDFPAGTLTPAGTGGWYYDWVVSRWLPVGHYSVSPDGRRYAIAKDWSPGPPSPSQIHVVDAATGADMVVATMPDQREYGVVDFTAAGVTVVPIGDPPEAGVWRLDPNSGALTKTSDGYYQPPAGEWIGVVDPRDPNHQFSHATGSPIAQPDRIDRRDDSGTARMWIYKPGYWLYWFAFTGSPLLLVQASRVNTATGREDYEFLLVTSPGRFTRLAGYSGSEPSPYHDLVFATGLADDHGVWISGIGSLYLIRTSGAISRVSDHAGVPVNSCR